MERHFCPLCDITFFDEVRTHRKLGTYTITSHHTLYMHLVKTHKIRTSFACHANCKFLLKIEKEIING